jgi:hypothetical protein
VPIIFLWAALPVWAAEFHVTPDGQPDGEGTEAAPWDIVTAFSHPAQVQPGDTIWLHGGTYPVSGTLTGSLAGSEQLPIVVRQSPGERATLDTGTSQSNRIAIRGSHTWYWGFEVMSSSGARWGEPARGYGIDVYESVGIKLINLVVHDALSGINSWSPAEGSETYGCLIYYTGWDDDARGHGHAIYTQNISGTKLVEENIFFAQYSHGVHAYTEGGQINDFHLEGNIGFENGVVSTISGRTRNILIGGAPVADNPVVISNFTWFGTGGGTSCDLGYGSGTANAQVTDNLLVGPSRSFRLDCPDATLTGNLFHGPVQGFDPADFPDNQYFPDTPPTGVQVFVRPNRYDAGRAHIVVFNWDQDDQVPADVSQVLSPGDTFEVLDSQNYFGTAVLEGSYDGGLLSIPMNLTGVSSLIGEPATPYIHSGPEFGAFILVRTGSGPEPDGAEDAHDAGTDAGTDAGIDAGIDAGSDEGPDAPDGTVDGTADGAEDDRDAGTGTDTAGPDGKVGGGCGCKTAGRPMSIPLASLLFLVLCAFLVPFSGPRRPTPPP